MGTTISPSSVKEENGGNKIITLHDHKKIKRVEVDIGGSNSEMRKSISPSLLFSENGREAALSDKKVNKMI